jgi:signal transduction histidine kinase
MNFTELLTSALLGLTSLFSTEPSIPSTDGTHWELVSKWKEHGIYHRVEAKSHSLIRYCRDNPEHFIQFPTIIQGAHEVFLDSTLLLNWGDPKFQYVRSYYGAPSIKCEQIAHGETLVWRGYSYAKVFRHFDYFPVIEKTRPHYNALAEGLNMVAAGNLLLLGLFTVVVFWGYMSSQLCISLLLSSGVLSLYFLGTSAGLLGISLPMDTVHRITELTLWIGFGLFFNTLRLQGVPGAGATIIHIPIIGIACFHILTARDGDGIQEGTILPMAPTILFGLYIAGQMLRALIKDGVTKRRFFEFLSLFLLLALCFNDALVCTFIIQGKFLFAFGAIGALFFFALSVNAKINQTYRERDYLRSNLEKEVVNKTAELQTANSDLERAMKELKETQGELLQSSRLVSLGTLAAGIAHEINNSLNYVFGSIRPLEKLVEDLPDVEKKNKILKLTKLMSEGLKLTFEIIKSLRSYTGLNQAVFSDVHPQEIVQTVITLIRGRIRENIQVEVDVPPNLIVYGSVVGLNQVFMNLMTNAISAMKNGGTLKIRGWEEDGKLIMTVQDSGEGIPEEIQTRIFEPFFTTREVGKGTGLGLFIVQREIERHKGKISLTSTVGQGTTFRIEFPLTQSESKEAAA